MAAPPALYYKPPLPFTGAICGGMRDGLIVVISGSVLQSCCRFQINFQCGSGQVPQTEVAFHFNPRFDEGGCVVCNSFERGKWQQEERTYEMPFCPGQAFEIRILVTYSSFLVAVNGKHFLEFKHRIPLCRVDTINVSGDLSVASISFQGPPSAICPSVPGLDFPQQTYPVPFRAPIYGGLFTSKSVIIAGKVLPEATRFHINLKAGDNIAFHLNPRFNENVVVRNSKFNGSWGLEERNMPAGMPLFRGQSFTIWMLCEQQGFKVTINGQQQFSYNHRMSNLQGINQLEVEGDVMLTSIQA
uniref:Galectin n=1 Tax=Salvator merianae TaxID=96440 RepID=A0A8D0CBW2_SALMN